MIGGQRCEPPDVRKQRGHIPAVSAKGDAEWVAQHLARHVFADITAQQILEPVMERLRPQERAHARGEFVLVERLGQEVVRAGFEAQHPVIGPIQRR